MGIKGYKHLYALATNSCRLYASHPEWTYQSTTKTGTLTMMALLNQSKTSPQNQDRRLLVVICKPFHIGVKGEE